MSYVPINLDVYTAAYTGALSGMTGRAQDQPSLQTTTTLEPVTIGIGAYAEAFDTQWDVETMGTPSQSDLSQINSLSENSWQSGRTFGAPIAETYILLVNSLITVIRAARIYFSGQAITPPAVASPVNEVANPAALTVLVNAQYPDNTRFLTLNTLSYWILEKTSTAAIDGVTVVATDTTGRYVRTDEAHPARTAIQGWYLDPATGNDQNTGLVGFPLATLREFGRRLTGPRIRALTTLNVLSNITNAADLLQIDGYLQPQGTLAAQGAGYGALNIVLRIVGQRTTATFVDPNTASSTALTMTAAATPAKIKSTTVAVASNGAALPQATINVASTTEFPTAGAAVVFTSAGFQAVAYTGKTATTLTGCTLGSGTMSTGGEVYSPLPAVFTVAGFDFAPHIGRMVEILTSATSGAVGGMGTITLAPELGVAWLQPLTQPSSASATDPLTTPLTPTQYPASTSTFRIYTTTTWAPNVDPGQFGGNQAVAFRDIEFTTATRQTSRGAHMVFEGCTLRRVLGSSNGGEAANLWTYLGCAFVFAAPPGGRTATQWPHSSGDTRHLCCSFINIEPRIREARGLAIFANSLFTGSQICSIGPNDGGRQGPTGFGLGAPAATGGTAVAAANYGSGFFNWPAPDLLGPSPSTTRASFGSAISIGNGAKSGVSRIYGVNVTAGTYGVDVRSGGSVSVNDQFTYQLSPVNPPSPGTPYLPATLRMIGPAGEIAIDAQPSHVPDANYRTAVTAGVALVAGDLIPLARWKDWEDAPFSRNAKGNLTGASILNIQT